MRLYMFLILLIQCTFSFADERKIDSCIKYHDLKPVEEVEKFPSKYSGYLGKYIVDINNDGTADTVYALHSSTTYLNGDFYFLPKPEGGVDEEAIDGPNLDAASSHVLPQELGGCSKDRCAYDEFNDLKISSKEDSSKKSLYIRSRYMRADLTTHEKTTYIYIFQEGRPELDALLKINPDFSMEKTCFITPW